MGCALSICQLFILDPNFESEMNLSSNLVSKVSRFKGSYHKSDFFRTCGTTHTKNLYVPCALYCSGTMQGNQGGLPGSQGAGLNGLVRQDRRPARPRQTGRTPRWLRQARTTSSCPLRAPLDFARASQRTFFIIRVEDYWGWSWSVLT